jgi:hypothetical protein
MKNNNSPDTYITITLDYRQTAANDLQNESIMQTTDVFSNCQGQKLLKQILILFQVLF